VRFGKRVVVEEQEVLIERGVSCLVGPSGLGKSTFLKQLLKELSWPYVPQELKFPPGRVAELAAHLASLNHCASPRTYLKNFVELMGELNLGPEYLHKGVWELSSGERQRVAVALQLARGCCSLLADEPTSQLDPQNSAKLMDTIKKRTKVSFVVTHDPVALGFCDRVFTLREGVLVEEVISKDCLEGCVRCFLPS